MWSVRVYWEDGKIQSWTPEEWEHILSTLAAELPEMTYPMMMYAKNDQGDTHIMTYYAARAALSLTKMVV